MKTFFNVLFCFSVIFYINHNNLAHASAAAVNNKQRKLIRWTFNHSPQRYFTQAAEVFAVELEKEAPNQFEVQIVMPVGPNAAAQSYKKDLIERVKSGQYEMSQIYTFAVAAKANAEYLDVLNLPFLFSSHEQFNAVAEGKIGTALLAKIENNSALKGLALAYSGGNIVMPSGTTRYNNLNSFKGKKHVLTGGKIEEQMLNTLGLINKEIGIDPATGQRYLDYKRLDPEFADSIDLTYADLGKLLEEHPTCVKYVNETHLFTLSTALVINKNFFYGLTKNQQIAIEKAAKIAAKVERQSVINDESSVRSLVSSRGIEIVKLTPQAKEEIRNKFDDIYNKFTEKNGREFLDQILAVGKDLQKPSRLSENGEHGP